MTTKKKPQNPNKKPLLVNETIFFILCYQNLLLETSKLLSLELNKQNKQTEKKKEKRLKCIFLRT